MADYDYLPTSNGSGDAVLMHIQAPGRLTSATVIPVDSVVNVPAKFIGTAGTKLASGFIDPTTKIDFKGHVSGSTIVIDAFAPGSTDNGNTAGQIVVIKPNTYWADLVARFIKNSTGLGTPENLTAALFSSTGASTLASLILGGPLTGTGIGGQILTYTPTTLLATGVSVTSVVGHYLNLGGLKECWGKISYNYVGGSSTGHIVFSYPASFFSADPTYRSYSIETQSGYAYQTVSGDGDGTEAAGTAGAFYLNNGGTGGGGIIDFFARGV